MEKAKKSSCQKVTAWKMHTTATPRCQNTHESKWHNATTWHHDDIMTSGHHDVTTSQHRDIRTPQHCWSRRNESRVDVIKATPTQRDTPPACIFRRQDDINLISAWHQTALLAITGHFDRRAGFLLPFTRYRKQRGIKRLQADRSRIGRKASVIDVIDLSLAKNDTSKSEKRACFMLIIIM